MQILRMSILLPVLLVSLAAFSTLATASPPNYSYLTLNSYDHFSKRLVLFNETSANGMKFCGGRLQHRHIAYIYEAGFKSVLALSTYPESSTIFLNVNGTWDSTSAAQAYCESLGMTYASMNATYSVDSVALFIQMFESLPAPVFIESFDGYMAVLFANLFFNQQGLLPSDEVFTIGKQNGYDFQTRKDAVDLVNNITNRKDTIVDPSINKELVSYQQYYWAHRLTDQFYNQGQPLQTQVNEIARMGYKTVISFRKTGESTVRLPSDPTSGFIPNDEFSDSKGLYNVTLEQTLFEAAGLSFVNLPVTGADAFTLESYKQYKPQMEEAARAGPVLCHCAVGYRSSAYVVAFLADQQQLCVPDAVQLGSKVGFSFDGEPEVMQFFQAVLSC